MNVEQLNFHHLRYFWAVAKDGNLTRTAARLHVSQSALSSQIHQLEEQFGSPLFLRSGRRLTLTEAGKIACSYAEKIFSAGSQLASTLQHGRQREEILRIGAVATLSRNFQESFVRPLLDEADVRLSLESGVLEDLIVRLDNHAVDLVLANRPPGRNFGGRLSCRRIARQPVSIIGAQRLEGFCFPRDIEGVQMILPGGESDIRSQFDALCEQIGLRVRILAEVDDMATMRLLVCDTKALALIPSVVVRDELCEGVLFEHCMIPELFETFYAITAERVFQHPLLEKALSRDENELLATYPRRTFSRSEVGLSP